MSVVDEVNQSKKVGKTANEIAQDKAKEFVQSHGVPVGADKMKSEAEQQTDQKSFLPPTAEKGDIGLAFPAKEVPQQTDYGVKGIGGGDSGKDLMKSEDQQQAGQKALLPSVDLSGPQDKVTVKTPQTKDKGVAPAQEVPQQTDQGKDGI